MERKSKMKNVKLTLSITEDIKNKFIDFVTLFELDNMSELLRRSIAVYEVVMNHHLEGGKILLVTKEGKEKELVIHPIK